MNRAGGIPCSGGKTKCRDDDWRIALSPDRSSDRIISGGGGIRTHGTAKRYTGLRDRPAISASHYKQRLRRIARRLGALSGACGAQRRFRTYSKAKLRRCKRSRLVRSRSGLEKPPRAYQTDHIVEPTVGRGAILSYQTLITWSTRR